MQNFLNLVAGSTKDALTAAQSSMLGNLIQPVNGAVRSVFWNLYALTILLNVPSAERTSTVVAHSRETETDSTVAENVITKGYERAI